MNIAELQTKQKIERLTLHQKHLQEMDTLKLKQEEERSKFLVKTETKS